MLDTDPDPAAATPLYSQWGGPWGRPWREPALGEAFERARRRLAAHPVAEAACDPDPGPPTSPIVPSGALLAALAGEAALIRLSPIPTMLGYPHLQALLRKKRAGKDKQIEEKLSRHFGFDVTAGPVDWTVVDAVSLRRLADIADVDRKTMRKWMRNK
jgi:hypothetical protein